MVLQVPGAVGGKVATPSLRLDPVRQPSQPLSDARTGLEQFGGVIQGLGERMMAMEDASQLAELETKGIGQMEELKAQVLEDPEFSTATGRYNAGVVNIIDALTEDASFRVRGALARQLGRRSIFGTSDVRKEAARRSVKATLERTAMSLDGYAGAFGRATDDRTRAFNIERARDTIGNALSSGAYTTEDEARNVFRTWLGDAERARVMGMVERAEYSDAVNFIDQSKLLDDETKISLRGFAYARQQAAQTAVINKNAQAVADLDISIGKARAEDLAALTETTAAMRSVMRPDKFASFMKRINVKKLKSYDDAVAASRFLDVLQGNAPSYSSDSPDDRDAVEAGWQNVLEDLQEIGASEEEVFEQGLFISTQTGVVPKSFLNLVNASLNDGNNPDRAVSAAKFVANIGSTQPRIAEQFDSKDVEYAILLDTLHARGGIPAADAVKDARDKIFGSTDNTIRFRQGRWTADKMAETTAEALTANLLNDLFPGAKETGFKAGIIAGLDPFGYFGTTAEHDMFQATYVTAVEALYTRLGDLDAAQTAAGSLMQKTWGLSQVDGKARIMFLPPEFSQSKGNLTEKQQSAWMREQLIEDAMQEGVGVLDFDLPKDPAERRDYLRDNMEIITDAITPGFPRTYAATVVDDLGIPRAMHNPAGEQYRWRPEFPTSPAGARMDKARREERLTRERMADEGVERRDAKGARRGMFETTDEAVKRRRKEHQHPPNTESAKPSGLTAGEFNNIRGLRNNNPLNIKKSLANAWVGLTSDQSSDPTFAQFTTVETGMRAAAKLLRNYQADSSVKTMSQFIGRWATTADVAYVRTITSVTGIQPDDVLDMRDDMVLLRLMKGMLIQEVKENKIFPTERVREFFNDEYILERIREAGTDMFDDETAVDK